ncbi:potassium channel family protein [Leptolyngbya sp. AN02str]|uniref:potassium channel family protein n=1 Tax=Leptolyngbya sp. AN02str TaxID=3423363 RepID=UPI003D31EBFC
MSQLHSSYKRALEHEQSEILHQLEDWLEIPMLMLSFVWLALFVVELIWELSPFLDALGITIWVLFILDFGLKFILAPRKVVYLRLRWLTGLALLLPALRILRVVRVARALQTARAVRGLRLLRVMTRTNRGMRALAASVNRRGFGYVMGLTAIVALVGSAGMYTFERDIPESSLTDYGSALWWTAMMITTMGSDYFPKTPEGRVLCLFLSLYAFAVFGYVTATLATFFIGRDAENSTAEVAGSHELAVLHTEIAALRTELHALLQQKQ